MQCFHVSSVHAASVKNPYSVLGVDKSASTSEIKKAYYAAAKKYHPDSSKEPNARERFQDVQSAYEILSDPSKKDQFDHYGEAAFDSSSGFSPGAGSGFGGGGFSGFGGAGFGADFSFEDIFSAFTGQGAGRGGSRGRGGFGFGGEHILVGENIEIQATIPFMDAAKGTTKEIRVIQLMRCKSCSGSGMKEGRTRNNCRRCGGTGSRVHVMQGGFQMASTCEHCAGQGAFIPHGSECKACRGKGYVREPHTVTVDIPAGVEDGMRLRIAGQGDAPAAAMDPGTKTQPGDMYVHIKVEPHKDFSRNGSDVLYTASIPMTTAILGGQITVPTLDTEVELKVPSGTNTGDIITIDGMGMKRLGDPQMSGDLRVEFKVNMPKSLSPSQRKLLELLADEMTDKTANRIMKEQLR